MEQCATGRISLAMHRTLAVMLAATFAGLAACATHGPASRPHSITFEVNNNLPVPTGMDIYIVGPAGTQWRLGYVAGGDSAEFSYRPDSYGQGYRLLAKPQLQRPIYSRRFTAGDDKTRYIVWTLNSNMVIAYNGVTTEDTVMTDTTKAHQ